MNVGSALLHFPYAILAGVLPSLVWLFFWNREDHEQPEPRSLLAGCFFGGMIVVFFAIPAEQFVAGLVSSPNMKYTLWAVIEELLKFVAVGVIALRSKNYDEPIDAMIYCITVALGFAALENTLFISGPFADGNLTAGLLTGNMRFFGATLVHVVSSAVIGFSLGLSFYKKAWWKAIFWVAAVLVAITMHAAFNISIVHANPTDTLKAFGWVWGAVVVLIVLFEEVKMVRPRLN